MRKAQPGTAAKLRLAQPIAAVLCFFGKAIMTDRDVWLEIRRLLLALVDVIERRWEVRPRTKEIRDWHKTTCRV